MDNELFPRRLYIGQESVTLASNRDRRKCVLLQEAMDIRRVELQLFQAIQTRSIRKRVAIEEWFASIKNRLLACSLFWQQISVINASLGQSIFDSQQSQLVYVPMELVCARLLMHRLETGARDWVTRSLVDKIWRLRMIEVLDGTRGFFNHKTGRGTTLFWRNIDGELKPVWVEKDGSSKDFPLDPHRLWRLIRDQRLIPSSGLAMLLLSFKLGLNNFGGLLQYDYLAQARQRLLAATAGPLLHSEVLSLSRINDCGYVNFECRAITAGGLLCLANPISRSAIEEDARLGIDSHTADCIAWLQERG